MKNEIRFKHTIMEYDDEIKFCKKILVSDATADDKKYAKMRIEEAEKNKKKLLKYYNEHRGE